ncbi:MAG: tRNA (adenosine(37)-N6)-threonylcarbamoyltransferase complex dimerization subunit type 1 TsaB [Phycisphaera sp.]|nr:tRNA (adenosine(37)-N6)-threonylcarbamoyltransferase complex dimerization subunit type 1 TsaB [Phycisphaera sp.]
MTDPPGLRMPMLAIELSQRSGGVAVVDEAGHESVVPVTGGRREKDELLPAVREALESANVLARDLATVAVDVGPGGFTGLRISIAAAQALAEVSGGVIVGVPGAEVAVASTPACLDRALAGTIVVISATRNETAWATRFHRDHPEDDWVAVGRGDLIDALPQERFAAVLADEHLDPAWRAGLGEVGTPILEPVHAATGLARLLGRLRNAPPSSWHVSGDAATLRPIYPREPEAVRLWKARPGR